MHVIAISLDAWPATWPGWTIYVNGVEMPMEGGEGKPVVRPNAPVSQPPTGLIVGTLPWVTGLDNIDFPCCGTIQLNIPGEGLTNTYEFNLHDFGCATASIKKCPSEWTVHEGDLVIEGTETRLIENAKFFQKGNIYVRDGATLILKNTELVLARGDVPTIHVYMFVDPMATLVIDDSLLYPLSGGLACVENHGAVRMTNSPTSIHLFEMSAGAQFTMANSRMVYTIGGLLQVSGGSTILTDSTIGALNLNVPAGAHLDVAGLQSGIYFDSWDVHSIIPDANYNLVLKRTTILKDDFTGDLEHGPYERGWEFSLDPDAHVRISDSELRKVFFDLRNVTTAFQDLRVGIPADVTYRDIVLKNVVVKGEWPFAITDSDIGITNSDYLFLQPSGSSTVRLINSHMVEFIPRNFSGTMIFENGLWTTAGEIIGGVPYHSMVNDFVIKGSLRMQGLRESLQWKDARVTREFDVIVTNGNGYPAGGVVIKVGGGTYQTDDMGKTKFNMVFDETNFNRPTAMEVWQSGNLLVQQQIDFFAESPIRVLVPQTYTATLPASTGSSASSSGQGSLSVSYGQISSMTSSNPVALAIFGFTQNGILVSEAGVSTRTPTTSARIFIDYNTANGSDGGVAIVNPNNAPITINVTLQDQTGTATICPNLTVPPQGHLALFASQLGCPGLTSPFLGTLTLTSASSAPFAAVNLKAVNNADGQLIYSVLPIADLTARPANEISIYPQFVDGGGYATQFLLMNTTASAVTGTVAFFDDNGRPVALNFGQGIGIQSSLNYSIAPNGMQKFSTTGQGSLAVAYAVVTPTAGSTPVAAVVFSQNNGTGGLVSQAGVLNAPQTTSSRLYVERTSSPLVRDTGIALVNRNGTTANVNLNLVSLDGTFNQSATLSVPANGHVAKYLEQLFPQGAIPAEFRGVLTMGSNVPIAPVTLRLTANQRGDQILSTLPVADLNNLPTGALILSQVVNGGGYTTQIILINTSSNGGTITITFRDDNGNTVSVPLQ